MKFDTYQPTEQLRPHVRYLVVSENEKEREYKVFPSAGLVIGFQYKGQLATRIDQTLTPLASSGITGISDGYRVFKNSAHIGTILVFFTDTGFAHFASQPVNELFNLSLSLDTIFEKSTISEVEEKLDAVTTDRQRVKVVEQFLLSQLRDIQTDQLICEAVKLIHQAKGNIRIKELNEKLFISQSPFEKRFRKVVGTTPKKFASIIRFNSILSGMNEAKSLMDICHENNFFDQSHFIKDFRQFTGDTPEQFKRLL